MAKQKPVFIKSTSDFESLVEIKQGKITGIYKGSLRDAGGWVWREEWKHFPNGDQAACLVNLAGSDPNLYEDVRKQFPQLALPSPKDLKRNRIQQDIDRLKTKRQDIDDQIRKLILQLEEL